MNREGQKGIGYLDFTWNPVAGCGHGCPWCWARRQAKRQKHRCQKCYDFIPHLHPERLDEPLRPRKPSVIGACFMGDLFDPALPDEDVCQVFDVMRACEVYPKDHTFVVLTKQPTRMADVCKRLRFCGDLPRTWLASSPDDRRGPGGSYALMGGLPGTKPLSNVVLGVSPWIQESADRLVPELLACPAAKRIVSIEPMLGPVKLRAEWLGYTRTTGKFRTNEKTGRRQVAFGFSTAAQRIDGVILGNQTGPGAVAMDPDWVRAVRDQCQAAGVPFYLKSWGAAHVTGRFPFQCEHAGRVLDGRTHDELAWAEPESLSEVRAWRMKGRKA